MGEKYWEVNFEMIGDERIQDGDLVKINSKKITSNKRQKKILNPKYLKFISENKDRIFTAKVDKNGFIGFSEDSTWIFLPSDLFVMRKG